VPRKAKVGLPLAKMFFLCKNAFKRAIARLSNQLGTIVRGDFEVSIDMYDREKICSIKILTAAMIIQSKL